VLATVTARLPHVMVKMLQIEQVLLNLIPNSVGAIRKAGQGTFAIEAAFKDADFVVRDLGDSGPRAPRRQSAPAASSTKKEGLASGCCCAGRSSRLAAAASASTPVRPAPPCISPCLPPPSALTRLSCHD